MPRVLHVLDRSSGWEQRVAIGQLLARLPAQDFTQHVVALGRPAPAWEFTNTKIIPLSQPLGLAALAAPALQRYARRHGIDLIHAWGPAPATAARAAFPERMPLVVTVFDPGLPTRDVNILRTVSRGGAFAVACAAERVRRRLVEQGVTLEQTVLLRPAVDFAAVTAARSADLRAQLGVATDALLILTPELSRSGAGHFAALWSALVRWYLDEGVRIVVPGSGPALTDLHRLARGSATPDLPIFSGSRYPFEHLCAAADVLALGNTEDISTTALAWAMASSTPIIAPATYAVAELIAHEVNGLLYKPPADPRRRGVTLCGLYDRLPQTTKFKEAARGQAYEVFSLRRFIDQQRRLYRNLLDGVAPAEGITDSARQTG